MREMSLAQQRRLQFYRDALAKVKNSEISLAPSLKSQTGALGRESAVSLLIHAYVCVILPFLRY
jgi:hypothetical protein